MFFARSPDGDDRLRAKRLAELTLIDPPTLATPPMRAVWLAHLVMWRTAVGREPHALGAQATAAVLTIAPSWAHLLMRASLVDPLAEIVIANACAGGRPLAD